MYVHPVEVDSIQVREAKRKLRLKERDVDGSSCGGEVSSLGTWCPFMGRWKVLDLGALEASIG